MRKGALTVLAPTNDALAKLPKGFLDDLQAPLHTARLVQFVQAYLLVGTFGQEELTRNIGKPLRTLGKTTVTPFVTLSGLRLNAAPMGKILTASNGVLVTVEGVLFP
jgi:uncharacterized surface protein with fasciclin (FAS1) repeats